MHFAPRFTLLALIGLFSVTAVAGELPSRFTLGRYVPGNVWMYVHEASSPERAWIEKKWEGVFDALRTSGIDRDITSFAMSMMHSDEDRTSAEALLDKWTGLIKKVQWSQLCSKEFVYAQRVAPPPVNNEHIFLTRSDATTAKKNAEAIVAILKELAALNDSIEVTVQEDHGAKVWSVKYGDAPVRLELVHKGDVIGMTTGHDAMVALVALLTGNSERAPFAKSPRLAEALKQTRSPEHLVAFYDLKAMVTGYKKMLTEVKGGLDPTEDADGIKSLGMVTKMFDLVNVLDYVVETHETDGRREMHHTVARLQAQKKNSPLASCFLDRKPFEKFDRYIPADATGFSMSTFVDVEGLYDFALGVVKTEIPEGEEYLAKWNEYLVSLGFDPNRDLFSWWSGEMISVSMPPAVVTPMGGPDKVFMLRIKDRELAEKQTDRLIDLLRGLSQGQGQALMVTPADVRADGFRQLTYPMLAMFLRPVIGVTDEWIVVGTSPGAINKCLDVAAGRAPSIMTNERFKTEGLIPKGPVLAASFKDTSKFGQELGQFVGMLGMVSGIGSGMIPPGPGTESLKKVIQKVSTMVLKLGPVFQKIDFYSSESSMTTYDGSLLVRSEVVVTYKEPATDGVKTAAAK